MIGPIETELHRADSLAGRPIGARRAPARRRARTASRRSATFNFAWLTAPGTAVFVAALLSMALLRMNGRQIAWVFRRTFFQMKIPIPTICFMLGLSYVTRYAGMDATLGFAFAGTGVAVSVLRAAARLAGRVPDRHRRRQQRPVRQLAEDHRHADPRRRRFRRHLDLGQAQVLICTSNSTGGVMGKMIDAQSIVVATAATNQLGKEADIFKAVLWHSIFLAVIVGLLTLLQAYVAPFTGLVPHLHK